jgi:serine/threonine protein kinase
VHSERLRVAADSQTIGAVADPRAATILPAALAGSAGHQWTARECPACGARYPGNYIVCPIDATPLCEVADGADPLIGKILGECYEIVRVIGYGGMATVYEAHHTRLLNKRFAIKLLLPEFAVKPELVVRFAREAETASRIEHANIVEVYDVHRTKEGTPYIVCEYLEGKELGDLLDNVGRLPPAMVVDIACQICDGLAAAHAAGVVHRDVKPENVFLTGEPDRPVTKLLDFGISKIAEADGDKLTRTGLVMGTPNYMPPEQARGTKVDHRADVYGVGAILYRALTGRLPFSGDDPTAVLAEVLTKEPLRPRAVEPSVPEGLELIIEHAMAKDRERRYPTIDALREDLQHWAESEGLWKGALVHVATSSSLEGGEGLDSNSVARASRHASRARPFIVVLSVLGFLWLCACLLELILATAAAVDVEVTLSERRLVFIGVLAVIITPAVFWSRHLVRRVWQNSVRALELAHMLSRVIASGLTGLAVGSLLMMLVVNLGAGTGESFWGRTVPLWLSLLGGGLGWAVAAADRRSADRRSRWRAPMLEASPQSS